jgi:hypothetical protein
MVRRNADHRQRFHPVSAFTFFLRGISAERPWECVWRIRLLIAVEAGIDMSISSMVARDAARSLRFAGAVLPECRWEIVE